MTIKNPQPVQINGVEYGLLAINLAMSSREQEEDVVTDFSATFTPYRNRKNRPPEFLPTIKIPPVNISAALNDKAKNIKGTDPELAQLINTIENAWERYLKARMQ